MNFYPNETSFDRGPFDLPRNFFYENITDYYLKKSFSLLQVKNFDLAIQELNGLLHCAIRKNETKLATEIEDRLIEAEDLLLRRNQARKKLKHSVDQFINDFASYSRSENINSNKAKNKFSTYYFETINKEINTFLQQIPLTEEYSDLISKICTFNFRKIEELEFQKAGIILTHTLNLVLTFDPLKYLLEDGRIARENGLSPFLLFDLDSTLFDNSPRVFKIVRDFIREHSDTYPEDIKKLRNLKREHVIWGIKENLNKLDITDEKIVSHVINYWFERFFSNEYIVDVPLKGAKQLVSDAQLYGINIIYLTGRFESMKDGTAKNILEHGFPLNDNLENLLLKPHSKIPDHVFKHDAMEKVKTMGTMIAGFDNEPLNTNIFKEHFPESEVFFLETNHSLNPPNLIDKIHTIPNFSYKD
jgi:hypothetical protein